LWFTEFLGNKIGRITTSGAFTEFAIPTAGGTPVGIAAGSDGALWFTELSGNKVGQIAVNGIVAEFPVPTPGGAPVAIAAGPDGALWFTEDAGKIGRLTTAGGITEFPINSGTHDGIAAGADGALWFTEGSANKIGRITTSGTITEFAIPSAASFPAGIAAGPDGALWFTEAGANKIGRITTSGAITEFPLSSFPVSTASSPSGIAAGPNGSLWFTNPGANNIEQITTSGTITLGNFTSITPASLPNGITPGPDGAMWFTEGAGNKIGRIMVSPAAFPFSPLATAVLPSSRSIGVGRTATAYATIINAGPTAAAGCAISPVTPVPASFVYQTSDPVTNALTGSPNTPVSIAPHAAQTFVIAFAANASVVPTTVALGFNCAAVPAAATISGVNTLLYSASATPVADIVANAVTAQNDGILHIAGSSAAFAVATVNMGASAAITATANTGATNLPLVISICQTNPATAQCLATPTSSLMTTIAANATPTFSIFATAGGVLPLLAATNRIFAEFIDANGVVRGSTSVAVETQ
jgi:streptogramin lyase